MMKIAWNAYFTLPLPEGHRFPMEKYDLIPEQLLYEGTIGRENIFSPCAIEEEILLKIHDMAYWQKLKYGHLSKGEIRKTGFPYSARLVHRERVILQGTIDCAMYAFKYGISLNVAGGTHHAFADRGEGFCLLNDIAVATAHLLEQHLAEKILIVDLDVHQGNGTACIFEHEPRVFTFSMHGAKNYPLRKEKSDMDVPLSDGIEDEAYLNLLDHHLKKVIDSFEPDFVFYQSGVDVLASDKLGRLALNIDGCKNRDYKVLNTCRQHKIPVAVTMGGGYSSNIADLVEAHANTFRVADRLFF